jgi:hypothetical protein
MSFILGIILFAGVLDAKLPWPKPRPKEQGR